MAIRPVFVPLPHSLAVVSRVPIEFTWFPGFSVPQKQRSVAALHAAAYDRGLKNLLEISTKSTVPLGRQLSAFNMEMQTGREEWTKLEVVYQASKVFEDGGPYTDILSLGPKEARRDPRLRASGAIVAFEFQERRFPAIPVTAFYDWLYVRTLSFQQDIVRSLMDYDGFTDIEFNPERSVNCQARSCATVVSLAKNGLLRRASQSFEYFASVLANSPTPSVSTPSQPNDWNYYLLEDQVARIARCPICRSSQIHETTVQVGLREIECAECTTFRITDEWIEFFEAMQQLTDFRNEFRRVVQNVHELSGVLEISRRVLGVPPAFELESSQLRRTLREWPVHHQLLEG